MSLSVVNVKAYIIAKPQNIWDVNCFVPVRVLFLFYQIGFAFVSAI